MSNDTDNQDEQDEATQALRAMQEKVALRSMSRQFIEKHFDPAPGPGFNQTPLPHAYGNEGLTPNIDWKARAESTEKRIAELEAEAADAHEMYRRQINSTVTAAMERKSAETALAECRAALKSAVHYMGNCGADIERDYPEIGRALATKETPRHE